MGNSRTACLDPAKRGRHQLTYPITSKILIALRDPEQSYDQRCFMRSTNPEYTCFGTLLHPSLPRPPSSRPFPTLSPRQCPTCAQLHHRTRSPNTRVKPRCANHFGVVRGETCETNGAPVGRGDGKIARVRGVVEGGGLVWIS